MDIVKPAEVISVRDTSIPGILPGMQVEFDTGHTVSIIQPLAMSHIIEIAVWLTNDSGNWLTNPHWNDVVYRLFTIDELNDELSQLIPGYQPIEFLPKGILAID